MHKRFHPKSNIDRLFLSRSEGGRGLIGVQGIVETAILGIRKYVRNSKERLLIAACRKEEGEDKETPNEYEERNLNENTMDTKTITWTIYHASNR